MELQIHDLVSSIRKEGVDAANEQAEKIIAEAKQRRRRLFPMQMQRPRQQRKLLQEKLKHSERVPSRMPSRQREMP